MTVVLPTATVVLTYVTLARNGNLWVNNGYSINCGFVTAACPDMMAAKPEVEPKIESGYDSVVDH